MEIKYREDGDRLTLAFGMNHYLDRDGDKILTLSLKDAPSARFVNVTAPYVYTLPENRRERFAEAALSVQWRAKFIRYALDEEDGEVRADLEIPYSQDQYLTPRQIRRALMAITALIDQHDPYLRSVIETNRIDPKKLP